MILEGPEGLGIRATDTATQAPAIPTRRRPPFGWPDHLVARSPRARCATLKTGAATTRCLYSCPAPGSERLGPLLNCVLSGTAPTTLAATAATVLSCELSASARPRGSSLETWKVTVSSLIHRDRHATVRIALEPPPGIRCTCHVLSLRLWADLSAGCQGRRMTSLTSSRNASEPGSRCVRSCQIRCC
jgi:hypothetical protein